MAFRAQAEELWRTVPRPPPLPMADKSGLAPVNDIKMHYQVFNAAGGDPVILLHGGLGSTLNWGFQVPELMKQHNAKSVEFKDVIKDGKAVLRALPKE